VVNPTKKNLFRAGLLLFRLAENRTACCTDEGNKETNLFGHRPKYYVSHEPVEGLALFWAYGNSLYLLKNDFFWAIKHTLL